MPAKPPLEADMEQRVVDHAEKHGYMVRKLTFLGVNGAPDRIFGRNGRTVAIEFKREKKKPTMQQVVRAEELRENFGWHVDWADNFADACLILNIPQED